MRRRLGPGKPADDDRPQVPRATQVWKKLLQDRRILIGTPIDAYSAKTVIAQFMFLNREDSRKPIQLLVNSPGGYVGDSLSIYDAVRQCRVDVSTVCIGQASGMAALLVAAGIRGQRLCLPTAQLQLVPLAGSKETDPQQLSFLRVKVYSLFAACTGRTLEQVAQDSESGLSLSAEEAVEYGLADAVVTTLPETV